MAHGHCMKKHHSIEYRFFETRSFEGNIFVQDALTKNHNYVALKQREKKRYSSWFWRLASPRLRCRHN